jgi:DNA mismatch endonuclease (patch repair protein)
MADRVSKESRSKNMKAVKSKRTKLEEAVSKELWRRGLRFRKNVKELYGKPDIAIKSCKVAIFIDSCFWHGCSMHYKPPATNEDFWKAKIEGNIKRDEQVTKHYRNQEWNILRIWEHDLKNHFDDTIGEIIDFIKDAKCHH